RWPRRRGGSSRWSAPARRNCWRWRPERPSTSIGTRRCWCASRPATRWPAGSSSGRCGTRSSSPIRICSADQARVVDQPLEAYQDEIYLAGLDGVTPGLPADLNELERVADGRLTPEAHAYIAGGAGSGDTVRENREAFRRWRIVPRMLTDVSSPSYASTVLGAELAVPFLLAPVGVLDIAHEGGE